MTWQNTTGGGEIASPQLYFELLQDGKSPRTLNLDPLPGGVGNDFDYSQVFPDFPHWARAGKVGTYYSNPFTIDSVRGSGGEVKVGLRLINKSKASSQGCGTFATPGTECGKSKNSQYRGRENGNDGAIDNVRIVDVTPVMEKNFSPAVQSVGRESTMTLTINNRSDLGQKDGWGFVDTLPDGLSFVKGSDVETTCVARVSIDHNKQTLSVSNGKLSRGVASCTIKARVTSTKPATYTNGDDNGNFSHKRYIDGPNNATVKFIERSVSWSKVGSDDPSVPLAGSAWKLTGPTPKTASTPAGGWPVGRVEDCVAESEGQCH